MPAAFGASLRQPNMPRQGRGKDRKLDPIWQRKPRRAEVRSGKLPESEPRRRRGRARAQLHGTSSSSRATPAAAAASLRRCPGTTPAGPKRQHEVHLECRNPPRPSSGEGGDLSSTGFASPLPDGRDRGTTLHRRGAAVRCQQADFALSIQDASRRSRPFPSFFLCVAAPGARSFAAAAIAVVPSRVLGAARARLCGRG